MGRDHPAGWTKTLIFIVASPLIGLGAGYMLMVCFYWIFQYFRPAKVDAIFRRLQLVSAALFSLSHGANDAQKTMGIIVGLLISAEGLFANETGWMRHLHLANADDIPLWVEMEPTPRSRSARSSADGGSCTRWGRASRSCARSVVARRKRVVRWRSSSRHDSVFR
jgi:hypothetical protein